MSKDVLVRDDIDIDQEGGVVRRFGAVLWKFKRIVVALGSMWTEKGIIHGSLRRDKERELPSPHRRFIITALTSFVKSKRSRYSILINPASSRTGPATFQC